MFLHDIPLYPHWTIIFVCAPILHGETATSVVAITDPMHTQGAAQQLSQRWGLRWFWRLVAPKKERVVNVLIILCHLQSVLLCVLDRHKCWLCCYICICIDIIRVYKVFYSSHYEWYILLIVSLWILVMSLQPYWHALWMSLIVEHTQWLLFLSGNHCVWGFLDLYPPLFVWPTMMDFCKEALASLDLICWTRCPHSAHWTKVCVCCGSTSPLLTLLFVKLPPVPTGCGELFSKTISSNVVIILKMLRMQSSLMILRGGGSGIECVGTYISWRVVSKP